MHRRWRSTYRPGERTAAPWSAQEPTEPDDPDIVPGDPDEGPRKCGGTGR